MATVDLDAKLEAAKAEVTGEPHTLTFRNLTLTLPAKMNALGVADACRYRGLEQTARLVEALVGEAQYQSLLGLKLDDAELGIVVDGVAEVYGLEVGESSASGTSSANGSKHSRPTSKGSTR